MSDVRNPSRSELMEPLEDIPANASANATMGDIIALRLSRRDLLMGGLATTVATAVSPLAMLATAPEAMAEASSSTPSFGFNELAAGSDGKVHVADGYDADVLIRWGDKVLADAPEFDPQNQSPATQALQFGYNNDFLGYIPLDGSSDHGLLVVNHEYTNEELMFPGLNGPQQDKAGFAGMTNDLAAIEMLAHGGSVIEIRKSGGKWSVVNDSRFNRRITASTEMAISGPAAGHAMMKTSADPAGTRVKGMINNCAGGITPWGTWLTCEENFNYYFSNKTAAAQSPNAKALKRYGIPAEQYAWSRWDDRFDVGKEPNESNRFGWIVEIDPMDPGSMPVKRTALGRFKHEGAGNIINKDGRFVVYSGDDQRFDYVYKFVTEDKVD
ncbi:MAG: PhoX family phosphatase, partial [Hyphomicrobiaceae bacterium]